MNPVRISQMHKSPHQNATKILTLLALLITSITEIKAQCCIKFSQVGGDCVECPINTHLYRSNCIFNKPNCDVHNGFDCSKCSPGYLLHTNGTCLIDDSNLNIVPQSGFTYLDDGSYNNRIVQQSINQIKTNNPNLTNFKLFLVSINTPSGANKLVDPVKQKAFLRILLTSSSGLVDALAVYDPKVSEVSIKSVTFYEPFSSQQFVNLQSDPNLADIKLMLNFEDPNTKLIEAFQSPDFSTNNLQPLSNYRIFFFSPNKGTFFRNKQFPRMVIPSNSTTTVTTITTANSIADLDPYMADLLSKIIQSNPDWDANLKGSTFYRLTQTDFSNFTRFNASYRFLSDPPANELIGESYFVFDVNFQTGTVSLVGSSFYKKAAPTNIATIAQNQTPPTPIAPPSLSNLILPTTPLPSLKSIDPSIQMSEYINSLDFIMSDAFKQIKRFLIARMVPSNPYQELVTSNPLRIASGQNTTHFIHEILYEVSSIQQTQVYLLFAVDKNKFTLELVLTFRNNLAQRKVTMVDETNRQDVLSSLTPTLREIIVGYVNTDAHYRPQAILYDMTIMNYTVPVAFNSSTTKPVMRTLLRYYFPQSLNLTYEFVEFRVEVLSQGYKKINSVIFPKEKFSPVENNPVLLENFDFYINQVVNLTGLNYSLTKLQESLDRPGIFKGELNFSGKYSTTYLINTYLSEAARVLSNITMTIVNMANLIKPSISVSGLSVPLTTVSELIPTPVPNQGYNVLYLLQNFPSKDSQPVNSSITISTNSNDSALTIDQIKKLIASFFNITIDTIVSTTVLKRQTLENMIDTYTVEFTRYLSAKPSNFKYSRPVSNPMRFTFEVSRKTNKITAVPAQKPAPRKNDNILGFLNPFSWMGGQSNVQNQPTVNTPAPAPTRSFDPFSALFGIIALPFVFVESTIGLMLGQPIQLSSQDFVRPPSILQSLFERPFQNADTANTNSKPEVTQNQQSIDAFLKQVPNLIPLQYEQNIKFNDTVMPALNDPMKPTTQALNFLNKIENPTAYSKTLATCNAQRSIQADSRVNMLKIDHLYYGNIRMWSSIADQKVWQTDYVDQGFQLAMNSTSILSKVPEIINVEKTIQKEVSKVLQFFGYTENSTSKNISIDDVVYWKFKKLNDLNEIELYYELIGFIIKVRAIFNNNQTTNPQIVLTKLLTISNSDKRNELSAQQRRARYSKQCKSALISLFQQKGALLPNSTILSVDKIDQKDNITFNVLLSTSSGFVKAQLIYVVSTGQTIISDIKSLNPTLKPAGLDGCLIADTDPRKCRQCSSDCLLSDDGWCYSKITNCKFQSREICLECQTGYITTSEYKCK